MSLRTRLASDRPVRICYVWPDEEGPREYRAIYPATELQRQYGWQWMMPDILWDEADLWRLDADIYVFGRFLGDTAAKLAGTMARLRGDGKLVVMDLDDLFLEFQDKPEVRPHVDMVKTACALTVSTPALADAYRRYNPNVHVVANALPWDQFDGVRVPPSEVVRVGYMGLLMNHSWDVDEVLGPWLGGWLGQHPNVQFVAAGDPTLHDRLDVPPDQRVSYEATRQRDLPKLVATMDIGLVPLADRRFNDCKSYLKGMEYAAVGVPCVASPSREYRTWVEPAVNGFLARRPRDWMRHLDRLVGDHSLRLSMSAAALAKAREHGIDRRIGDWFAVYARLLRGALAAS